MPKPRPRRERLVRLLDLAQTYRGWSQRELARELERDPHNLVPDGGVPRLDLVLRLSEALDWPVEGVIADLCEPAEQSSSEKQSLDSARWLNAEALDHLVSGRYQQAVEVCNRVVEAGYPPPDTAYALQVLANALEGQGRYMAAIDAARRGLRLVDSRSIEGLSLRGLTANLHYSIGNIHEAEGMATSVVQETDSVEVHDGRRHHQGYARYVRGNCRRVLAGAEAASREHHAVLAVEDLERASSILDDYRSWGGNVNDAATASIARGGMLEMEVLLGKISPEAAIDRFQEALTDPSDQAQRAPWWQESRAWWCVFACNVALRHIEDEAYLERLLAIFTNKADELAESLGHWALREQIWTIEHIHRRLRDSGDIHAEPWILDVEEIRALAGTMGRFPVFRETGWQILQKVRTLGEER